MTATTLFDYPLETYSLLSTVRTDKKSRKYVNIEKKRSNLEEVVEVILWHLQYLISQLNVSGKVWNHACSQFHCIS